jgi:hypothetical protein
MKMIRKASWIGVAVFATLLVLWGAPPARAQVSQDVESRLQVLEQELQKQNQALGQELEKLKAEQVELRQEALQAADAAPTISWRPGRGFSIRGADRSWEFNLSFINQTWVSFFPDDDARSVCDVEVARATTISTTSAGSAGAAGQVGGRLSARNSAAIDCNDRGGQFSMVLRRLRPGFTWLMADGLYEMGFTLRMETAPEFNFNGGGVRINFNKFSPYYPKINMLSIQAMNNPSGTKLSSSSGLSLDRSLLVGSTLRDGNGKGYGMEWQDVPFLSGNIESFDVSMSSGNQFTSKTAPDPIDKKGLSTGIIVNPFKISRGIPFRR